MKGTTYIVAEDAREATWLLLDRLRSTQMCRRNLAARAEAGGKELDGAALSRKAEGMASAIDSALGYWAGAGASLNSRIVSRYYALMHLTIAEQVASLAAADDLAAVQRHTRLGHGLATVEGPGSFPENYFVGMLSGGHFNAYLRGLGSLDPTRVLKKRPDAFPAADEADKLESLGALLRRIPELAPVIGDYLPDPPLSFRVVHARENDMAKQAERELRTAARRGGPQPPASDGPAFVFARFFGPGVTRHIGLFETAGLREPTVVEDPEGGPAILGKVFTDGLAIWWDGLPLTSSSHADGSRFVVPAFGLVRDTHVLHLAILYTLSIIARYLPNLWREINSGPLDHMRSLFEYYLAIVDAVVLRTAYERISGARLHVRPPGTLF